MILTLRRPPGMSMASSRHRISEPRQAATRLRKALRHSRRPHLHKVPVNWRICRTSTRSALPIEIRFPVRLPRCFCFWAASPDNDGRPVRPVDARCLQRHQDVREELRSAGITDDQIRSAAYALCATSDDIVQNLPSAGRHQWTQYSMLTQFFGQATGGVEFYQLLEKAKQDPGRNYGVLEVMHSCLSLGFYGKYRAIQGGQQGLERERRDLHEILRRVRPRPGDDLSPIGVAWNSCKSGQGSRYRSGRSRPLQAHCFLGATSP